MSREQSDVQICRSCHADIVWLLTSTGRKMPVNADTVQPGDEFYESGRHVSHFATCPNADEWRKRK